MKFQTQIGNFRKMYCQKMKRNFWVLGYFLVPGVNVSAAYKIASEYAEETGLALDSIHIETVPPSIRYDRYKYIYSLVLDQEPLPDAEITQDFYAAMK